VMAMHQNPLLYYANYSSDSNAVHDDEVIDDSNFDQIASAHTVHSVDQLNCTLESLDSVPGMVQVKVRKVHLQKLQTSQKTH
jgi:hypothetical protein